jgi:hypothetical protein
MDSMNNPFDLQAHCQSPPSQRGTQSFVKELAKPTQFAKGILAIAQKQNKFVLRG